jgi:hypothetical protein
VAGLRERLQSYIRHREWAPWARANMESAEAAAPIVLNGFWRAKPVNGVMLPGVALVAMRGRSVSSQAWEGNQLLSAGHSALRIKWLLEAQGGKADARELVGHRAGCLVAMRTRIQLQGPSMQSLALTPVAACASGRLQDAARAVREHACAGSAVRPWRCDPGGAFRRSCAPWA